jgi:hypothetical protein
MNEQAIKNRIRATLLEMSGSSGQSLLERLDTLRDILENKPDPDQNEIFILDNIYQVVEGLNLLKENLEKHSQGQLIVTEGSKLSELFDKKHSFYY